MARLMLDTARVSYEVSLDPEPKLDMSGQQKFDKDTKYPMWTVGLYALTPRVGNAKASAEVINVTVVSPTIPQVAVRQPVVPVDLEALPWANDRDGKVRSGIAFRASELRPIEVPSK